LAALVKACLVGGRALELGSTAGVEHRSGRLVVAGTAHQIRGATLEPAQRGAREDPLLRRGALPSSGARAMICCSVVVRSERPRPRKLTDQRISALSWFLKPVRYTRCTASQISQARNPVSLSLPIRATARNREIVARLPLSK